MNAAAPRQVTHSPTRGPVSQIYDLRQRLEKVGAVIDDCRTFSCKLNPASKTLELISTCNACMPSWGHTPRRIILNLDNTSSFPIQLKKDGSDAWHLFCWCVLLKISPRALLQALQPYIDMAA
jgi:hypothetical protein